MDIRLVTLPLFFSITIIVRADCESDTKVNNRSTCFLTDNQRIGIFGGLLGSLITLSTLRAILFFLLMLNASRIVHNRMFARVLRAPILFFDTNPVGKHHMIIIHILSLTGRVLNRFSKDVGFLDDQLIISFINFLIVR